MEALGCNPDCTDCTQAGADDCTKFAILAAYSEEAGDPALDRLHLALGTCVIPGGAEVPAIEIIRQIKGEQDTPCSNSANVSEDTMAAAVTLIGFSVFLLVNTVLSLEAPKG
jgi:hypothetical protein